jgi:gamma-glutamylaminecyclotransferase
MKSLIFVYGTLKQGGSNHGFLAGQNRVGAARTAPGFVLYELDGYPGMVARVGSPSSVTGEVWSVDAECLDRLDELEGTDQGLYRREPIPLVGPFAGQSVEGYVYLQPVDGRRLIGDTWEE